MPKLPHLLDRKIYKTGQTRGADDDEIFQNRVGRNSTILIPYEYWGVASKPPEGEDHFESGFIVLISPQRYFKTENMEETLASQGLKLGENMLVFYERREDWKEFNPETQGWSPASSRLLPLNGKYVARISATTALDTGAIIRRGFTTTSSKGAGIRPYEYASKATIHKCRLQLEALFWLCVDASEVAYRYGMSVADVSCRQEYNMRECEKYGLLDLQQLVSKRLISKNGKTICPLCLEKVSALGFFSKVEQAEGRSVHDLTITQLNLFHVEELRIGRYGHRQYNLGWGHHHCNVVVKDSGIDETLIWMTDVVDRNIDEGYIVPKSKGAS